MAILSAALPYIAAASTVVGVAATVQKGRNEQALLEFEAAQREEDAKAAEAGAQREALAERRRAKNLMSRARAIAGASGAGVSDETVNTIIANIDTQGEMNALNALSAGSAQARGLRSGAAASRADARASRAAANVDAASVGLRGATSWYDKYGVKS